MKRPNVLGRGMAMVAGLFLLGGCESGKDLDPALNPGAASGSSRSNTRNFDDWKVGSGHPWQKMKEQREEKKAQKRLEKKMREDEEAFREAFPRDWNEKEFGS
ncbi:MAG: hypothetical protein AAGD22_08240 [Verrucomicrobiota bacterium]